MGASRKYPLGLRERAVPLVFEWGRRVRQVAHDLGVRHQSLRIWVRQAEAGTGPSPRARSVRCWTRPCISRKCQSESRAQRVGSLFRSPAGVSVVVCFLVMPPAGRRSLRPGVWLDKSLVQSLN